MKTDNYSLKQKVELRREVCALLGEPLKVLDLFAGEGRVWWGMKEFCQIESYTPVDQRPRMSGVIKMTVSARTVRGFDLSEFNVI
jgi:ubiquinone/menaquinone biosynthesis C-methylase UbiE